MPNVAFVNSAHNETPASSHASSVAVTIPATSIGNSLVVMCLTGDDPTPPAYILTVVASGASFSFKNSVTNVKSHAEVWLARSIPAGIVTVTVTFSNAAVATIIVGEYSNVNSIGQIVTVVGATANPSISITTTSNNNMVAASFGNESTAQSGFASTSVGTFRTSGYAFGDGAPDVAGALSDNSSATPAVVTNTLSYSETAPWAAIAIELSSDLLLGTESRTIVVSRN